MFNFRITEDQQEVQSTESKGLKAKNVPFLLLLALIVLIPIFFLPATVAALSVVKLFVIYLLTIVSLFVWILLRLKDQSFSLPFNLLSLSIALIPTIYILSGIFSKNVNISFFARDFALDSVVTMVVFFILLTLSALQFKNKIRVIYAYVGIVVSFLVVAVLHLLNVLIPAFPSLGVFFNSASTTLGKWNDLALFSVLVAALAIMTLHLIRLAKEARIITYVAAGLALVMLIIINFKLAWYVLGLFSLLFFIYMIVGRGSRERSTVVPFFPLLVFLLSFLFIVAGSSLGGYVADVLNINHFEVRPSWGSTVSVVGDSIASRPVLGSGPALFEVEWLLNKPSSVLLTDFWNLDFRYGVGLIPSFFATTGVLGGLSWIFFIVLFLFTGFKSVFKQREDAIMQYLLLSSFVMSAILWAVMIFYLPSASMIALTFIMTGIYLSLLYQSGALRSKVIPVDSEPRFSFLYITVLVLILIGTIGLGYHATSRFVAHTYFQNAVTKLNVDNDLTAAESSIRNALRLENNDIYLRSLGELGTLRIGEVLGDSVTPQDVLLDQFRNYLAGTIESYQSAIEYDPLNHNNYVGLARLYRDLVALDVQGSYEQSLEFYNKGLELKVNAPDIYLELARLEVSNGDNEKAKEYINQAISAKPNYIDAVFLFSQIEVSEGNISEAIAAVEAASVIQPNNPTVFFQLGLLQYNNRNFSRALAAFERSVVLNPQFQNAKYFLGLSYYQTNNVPNAIAQFRDLQALNPTNVEIEFILNNLSEGRAPFANAVPPIDEEPEDREELPLDDGELTTTEGEEQ